MPIRYAFRIGDHGENIVSGGRALLQHAIDVPSGEVPAIAAIPCASP